MLSIGLVLLFLSCSKSKELPEVEICLISEVNGFGKDTYTYDVNGNVVARSTKPGSSIYTYSYTPSTITMSIEDYKQIYKLDTKERIVSMNDGSNVLHTYNYNSQGNLIEQREDLFRTDNSEITRTYLTKYFWTNNNMTRKESFVYYNNNLPSNAVPFVIIFEYNTDKSPLSFVDHENFIEGDIALYKFFGKKSQNLVSSKSEDFATPVEYKYVKDASGNIIKVTLATSTYVLEYQYTCK